MEDPKYRAPTPPPPPPPQVFEVPIGAEVQRGLVALAVTVALGSLSLLWSRGAFVFVLVASGAVGTLLMFFLTGGARRIAISADRIQVDFLLRGSRELSTAELEVQYLPPAELYLVTPEDTIELDPRRLGPDEARVVAALQAVARETVTAPPREAGGVPPRRPRQ